MLFELPTQGESWDNKCIINAVEVVNSILIPIPAPSYGLWVLSLFQSI